MGANSRKLRMLEGKVLEPPKPGTSRIVLEEPNELALFDACERIVGKINADPDCELTAEETALLENMNLIAWCRAYDIFCEVVGGYIWLMRKEEAMLFKIRLILFVRGEIDRLHKIEKELEKSG